MINTLAGLLSLLKIILLLSLGVLFVSEPIKKSLRPLGFLLFSVANSFLLDDLYIKSIIDSAKIPDKFLGFFDLTLINFFLKSGVNFAIVAWIVLILISEIQIRLLIKDQNKKKCFFL